MLNITTITNMRIIRVKIQMVIDLSSTGIAPNLMNQGVRAIATVMQQVIIVAAMKAGIN